MTSSPTTPQPDAFDPEHVPHLIDVEVGAAERAEAKARRLLDEAEAYERLARAARVAASNENRRASRCRRDAARLAESLGAVAI